MRIDIITVLPEMLESFFNCSIMSRAQKKGIAEIHIHNLRDYAYDRYRKVDDYPFAFLDAAIPDSQELVLFATELTANWFTSWFIQNFGCDAYFAHNKKLLFDDMRAQLLQDIDAAKQEKDN